MFFGWLAKYDQKAQQKSEAKTSFEDDKRKHFILLDKILADELAKHSEDICPMCQGRGSIPQQASA